MAHAQAAPKAAKVKGAQGTATKKQAPAAPMDVNTATAAELNSVPGIGAATAKKIIAGRPYGSVDDLKKTGMSAKQLAQIAPMLTARGGGASTAAAPAQKPARAPRPASTASTPTSTPPAAPAKQSAAPKNAPSVAYTAPPSPGMVWVNKETKVYHKQGDPWYGRTKQGSYMTEADALKAGYRASKEK
jgi:hypothetical protein